MKSRSFSVIVLFLYLIVPLLGGSAYSDVIWTKSFNYSGKIIEEGPDYIILKTADGMKKIPRKNIEDITYSKNASLPAEEKRKIQQAGESLERVVQEQLKWRRDHPKEYARQLRDEENARKKEEAQEQARLKKLQEEEKKEEARLQRLLEKEMRAAAAELKREMAQEELSRRKAEAEAKPAAGNQAKEAGEEKSEKGRRNNPLEESPMQNPVP
jgi:hypothetical protein